MSCPQCGEVALSTKRLLGIVRHRCAYCCGVWFDRAALLAVGEQLDQALDEPLGVLVDSVGPRDCPRCARAMLVELVDERIRIDICHEHGVWLDQSEVEAALESLMLSQDSREAAATPWWRAAIRAALAMLD